MDINFFCLNSIRISPNIAQIQNHSKPDSLFISESSQSPLKETPNLHENRNKKWVDIFLSRTRNRPKQEEKQRKYFFHPFPTEGEVDKQKSPFHGKNETKWRKNMPKKS
ncbi:MAG: hypothetical protein IK005_12730 [Paludibacteraceae bacterium]|nr:hypothetical protein [Paludibacteraceae bacterium]